MNEGHKTRLRRDCPELAALPKDWDWKVEKGTNRIYFSKINKDGTIIATFVHPQRGTLPKEWNLIVKHYGQGKDQRPEAVFHNIYTENNITKDPRHGDMAKYKEAKAVKAMAPNMANAIWTSRNHGLDLTNWRREPIGDKDIRNQFEIGIGLLSTFI